MNGEIISGNTASIKPVGETPIKFSEHRNSEKMDYRRTDFYIPPERNPQSKDKRMFTNKMRFVPASVEPQKHEVYIWRLGSKDTLKEDLSCLKSEDFRLFGDLTSNFVLCMLAASKEMKRRSYSGL